MSYREAVEFLCSLQMFGARPGLDISFRLARLAGNPQHGLRFIHVAGTNGKGSTCAMLESIYRASGLRVGLYTSPHLVSFRERIQVNRELIGESDVVRFVKEAREWLKEFSTDDHPTFFEVVTIMALRHFENQKCDLVIWETGLGGRLDATNIVTPLAGVITNVQLDHEKWLGETLEKIAREKAGIIKPRVPVITAADDPSALSVVRETAERLLSPLHVVSTREASAAAAAGLRGEHQLLNAALARKTVEVLQESVPVAIEAIPAGLANVQWPGRFQLLQRGSQTFILDGAHNPAGAQALAKTFIAEFGRQPLALVLGVLEDKNWDTLCRVLAPMARRIIAVPVASKRTCAPEKLALACRNANAAANISVATSLREALADTAVDRLVLIAGSLYLVGEALELLGTSAAPGERRLNEWSAVQR